MEERVTEPEVTVEETPATVNDTGEGIGDGRVSVSEVVVEMPDAVFESESRKRKKKEKAKKVKDDTLKTGKKVKNKADGFWANFKKFVAKGNIVDLAVAVVVGTAFNKVVNSLVSNIITPLTSRLLPQGDFSEWKIVLVEGVEADEAAGIEAVKEVAVTWGNFVKDTLDFLIIALTIYFALRLWLKVKDSVRKKERLAAEKKAKELEEKKKAEAAAEAERLERIKEEFIANVAAQADILAQIRDILSKMEKEKHTSR